MSAALTSVCGGTRSTLCEGDPQDESLSARLFLGTKVVRLRKYFP